MVDRGGFVESEGTQRGREEFPPFSRGSHMFDDFRHQRFVFLFGVLLVENAVLFPIEARAPEEIL